GAWRVPRGELCRPLTPCVVGKPSPPLAWWVRRWGRLPNYHNHPAHAHHLRGGFGNGPSPQQSQPPGARPPLAWWVRRWAVSATIATARRTPTACVVGSEMGRLPNNRNHPAHAHHLRGGFGDGPSPQQSQPPGARPPLAWWVR